MFHKSVFSLALMLVLTTGYAEAKNAQCCAEVGGCHAKGKGGKKPQAGSMYQITFTQSGGIAGINKTMNLDSSTLKKPEQSKLADLVAATGILKVDTVKQTTPNAADMFFYEFEINCCGKVHKATFDDGTLPASYRALKDYLATLQPKK